MLLRRYTIKISQLETILAIEKGESFAKAAEIMHLTVPAITKTIRNLEEELGLTVLDRSSYRVSLNAYGLMLAAHAQNIMTEIDDAKRNLNALKNSTENHIRISAAPAFMYELLPKAVNILRKQVPDSLVHLNASSIFSAYPIDHIKNGVCDLAITPVKQGVDLSQFSIDPIMQMEIDIIASDNHPALKLKKPKLQELVHYDWLLPTLSNEPFEIIEAMFRENGATMPERIQAIPFRPMIHSMFLQGDYLAALPNNNKLFTRNLEKFKKININSQGYGWTHYIVQRKYSTKRPIVQQFIDIIKSLITE